MAAQEKNFLTYNQQMKKLRNDKKISCGNSTDTEKTISVGSTKDKEHLVRMGYFNIINGYKDPFINAVDSCGNHIYYPGTSLEQIYHLKKFDEHLRLFLLGYIAQVEEEVRTLTAYKFDQCNDNGKTSWYEPDAYDSKRSLQNRIDAISTAYRELSTSRLEYVQFYMANHSTIPTWIMMKAIYFSTFIKILQNSKPQVTHSICMLYDMTDSAGMPNVKLLVGSLHWMRKVRNSCAHNERVYSIGPDHNSKGYTIGRIKEKYFAKMRQSYLKEPDKRLMDLLVYFKYFLPVTEYAAFIKDLKRQLEKLQTQVPGNAFDNVRAKMGIKSLNDLDDLDMLPKAKIKYNTFDSL